MLTCIMLQENSVVTEAVSNEDNIKINIDQPCDTDLSDDLVSDGEARGSLQSVVKSSSGHQLGSSTEISEKIQPDKSMLVCGTAATLHSNDLKQVNKTILGSMEHTASSK